jgi:hypothetical protein
MTADIHLIDGDKIATPGHPDPQVVATIEMLLEAAKSGRITGISYCTVFNDQSVAGYYCGEISRAQVGSLFAMMGRISREVDE